MFREFLDSIREELTSVEWARGVGFAREGAVSFMGYKEGAPYFQLRISSMAVTPEVSLWPDEEDYYCNCGSGPVCAHIAAAAIYWGQNAKKLKNQSNQSIKSLTRATLRYNLVEQGSCLLLERVFVLTHEILKVKGSLVQWLDKSPQKSSFSVCPDDLTLDTLLIRKKDSALNRADWRQIFSHAPALSFFSGESKVLVSCEERGLIAKCWRQGPQYNLSIVEDPEVEKYFQGGVCRLQSGAYCLRSFPDLDDFEKTLVGTIYQFGHREAAEIFSERFKSLAKKMPLQDTTKTLENLITILPHLKIKSEFDPQRQVLVLQPTIVYGDPPIAEVYRGELILLGNQIPARNLGEEKTLCEEFEGMGLSCGENILDVERALSWLEKYGGKESFAGPFPPDLILRTKDLVPDFSFDGGTSLSVNFSGQDSSGGFKLSASSVLRAWANGSSFIRLNDFGYAALPKAWLSVYGERLQRILSLSDEGRDLKSATAIIPELICLSDDFGVALPSPLATLRTIIQENPVLPPFAPRAQFTAVLRSYQNVGAARLKFHMDHNLGLLLADDMGLGKTVQTAAVIPPGSLIIVPRSLLENWQRELNTLRPDLTVYIYHGDKRKLSHEDDVVLTTYGIVKRDNEVFIKRTWPLIVADEAREFKNPESQAAKIMFQLQGSAKFALTGTPIENNLSELWSIMNFVAPGLLGTRDVFHELYSKGDMHKQISSAQEVRRLIKPFILRRKKKDVLTELPEKIEKNIYFDLDPESQLTYNALLASRLPQVKEMLKKGGGYFEALQLILRLRQLCCHPGLVDPEHLAKKSEKISLLVNWLENSIAGGHKALVFSQWTGFLDLIEPSLREAGITFLRLDGATQNRGDVVDRFQNKGEADVFLLSLKAGGIGLNLTAADHVYILDPWWNPAIEDQAADRAHRFGQDRSVMVMRLIASGTIEEKILSLQATKRALYEEVLDRDDTTGNEVNMRQNTHVDDLLTLFDEILI